jgi:tetratricopeptide (TPR) repeat protein
VRGNTDEIDLRTDIYSLGVILYELVTGQLPLDVSKAQLHEAVRIICDEPPKSLASTFAGRRRLNADVITIATKCLEKEPARRYQSVTALGEDVQRWLTDQPILARRPSAAYQLRKLVLRHKLPFAFAAAVFVLLAVFAGAMAVQAARIARERDRANQAAKQANEQAAAAKAVSDFLEEMFSAADPSASRGSTVTAKEILDAGAARVRETLTDQPLIQARLMGTIGSVYERLNLFEESERVLRQAMEIERREKGENSADYGRSLIRLGKAVAGLGRGSEARELFQKALHVLEKVSGPSHLDVGWCFYWLALASANADEKRRLFGRALKIFEQDPEHSWQGREAPTSCRRCAISGSASIKRDARRRQSLTCAEPLRSWRTTLRCPQITSIARLRSTISAPS